MTQQFEKSIWINKTETIRSLDFRRKFYCDFVSIMISFMWEIS